MKALFVYFLLSTLLLGCANPEVFIKKAKITDITAQFWSSVDTMYVDKEKKSWLFLNKEEKSISRFFSVKLANNDENKNRFAQCYIKVFAKVNKIVTPTTLFGMAEAPYLDIIDESVKVVPSKSTSDMSRNELKEALMPCYDERRVAHSVLGISPNYSLNMPVLSYSKDKITLSPNDCSMAGCGGKLDSLKKNKIDFYTIDDKQLIPFDIRYINNEEGE